MYLKKLYILSRDEVIRKIDFRTGINLIVDMSEGEITGNDIGKTTTLRLIDFCLGGKRNPIYSSPENPKDEYKLVKDFLVNNEVLIQLYLSNSSLKDQNKEILIERNFLLRKKAIRRINGTDYSNDQDFEIALQARIFPNHISGKPTFRQLLSHNIRYENDSLDNTLRTIHTYASDSEYESLHLFMLGCDSTSGDKKQELLLALKTEENFKKRLEQRRPKNSYEVALNLILEDIISLDEKKSQLNLNPSFEEDLNSLNEVKYKIHVLSGNISDLELRKDIIQEAREELEKDVVDIDKKQLWNIYNQAVSNIEGIQKTFEELLEYHNKMISNKILFITKELPSIDQKLKEKRKTLKGYLKEEAELTEQISKSDSFEELEKIISEINVKYQIKGEYENVIFQITEIEDIIETLEFELQKVEENLFSTSFSEKVKQQINKFNSHFSQISELLYGERYALTYEVKSNRNGRRHYKFSTFDVNNPNISSGKKQGEITCFEIAYILFARQENISHLSFILNDKKELMHGNQLVRIAKIVKQESIQFICSILEDKLPNELKNEAYYILKLSQSDKLFRIEKQS